jgi:hypothetical protein
MVSSRVLLYGESYAMRYQTTTVPSFATLMAAPLRNETVSVNFASCATDLPVLSRCGEFLVRYGPSYCVLESSQMTLDQLRAVLASGELFHVAAGEVVWNALLATDNGADDDDGEGDETTIMTVVQLRM